MNRRNLLALGLAPALPTWSAESKSESSQVRLRQLPEGAIQPQVVTDDSGVLHVVYYSGDARSGTLHYAHSKDWGATPSKVIEVNARGSALAAGTIRGAQLALGKDRRVHVAWNGSGDSKLQGPVNPDSTKPGAPMLYTRLNDSGDGFEPERNLMHDSFGLDGGGSIAADPAGNVYVFWHGIPLDPAASAGLQGEARRQARVAKSQDNGRSFAHEASAWSQSTGACACCGTKVFASRKGSVFALYRSATNSIHRDIYLLRSNNQGKTFEGGLIHRWEINACPMSSMEVVEGPDRIVGAWETGGQVFWSRIDGALNSVQPIAAPGEGKGRKHPRLAINQRGEMLFVWTEGTGWQKGGSFAWQGYDRAGKPTSIAGTRPGIATWSFAAPSVNADGSFSILY